MIVETLQNGRYRFLRLLGQGGMGEVYLAEDTRITRQVAIKVIRTGAIPYPDVVVTEDAIRLFQNEAKVIATLNHPHILPLFDYGEEMEDQTMVTYMVMPFCSEGSFADWLHKRSELTSLSPEDVVQFVRQAADALQHAHDHQIIHRDVKPSNFLIRSDRDTVNHPDLLLTDFGIARFNTDATSQTIRGTPTYMAPEQWSGVAVPATDQYALAIMAYEMLTGHPPFQGTQEQAMYRHLVTQPQPPSTLNSRLPTGVDAVILRALAKQPTDRFASITDFARALQQALLHVHTSYGFEADIYGPTLSPISVTQANIAAPVAHKAVQPPTPTPTPQVYSSIGTPSANENVVKQQGTSRNLHSRRTLLIGLALLIIAASVGLPLLFAYQKNIHNTSLQATAAAQANLTATAVSSHYPFSNTMLLDDPLNDNSRGHNWMENTNATGGSCDFTASAYHIGEAQQGYFNTCFAQNMQFKNFTYQVEMSISQGDAGGIVFRADSANTKFYYLRFEQGGYYQLRLYVDGTGLNSRLLTSGLSSGFALNSTVTNLIAAVVRNDTIELYLNQQLLTTITDSTYSQGQIGVTAEDLNTATEVVFTNAKVWKLP